VDVTVLPMEDLYFIPLAFRVADGNWTEVREAAEMMRLGTNIDRVAFEFRVNPLVGVLWAGVWMMIGGMVVRVAIDQGRPRLGRKATVPVPARVVPRTPTYEDRLEEELRGRGGGT
jgi:hypothetical protein